MLNKVVLMGRLTDNPELRHTSNDVALATFTLAVERNFRSGDERVTDFLDIVCWRNTAEYVSKYFVKGQLVAVEGSIQVRSYTDKNGNNRRAWDIVASQVYFAESRRDRSANDADFSNAAIDNTSGDDFTEFDGGDDLPF
ncbi:MAG: single-stranded DNA-binding protein [Acutalibacteraceae bacterium]|nr:single-stranded DNA-binding protein [Acutalibacteraceae bacterium]